MTTESRIEMKKQKVSKQKPSFHPSATESRKKQHRIDESKENSHRALHSTRFSRLQTQCAVPPLAWSSPPRPGRQGMALSSGPSHPAEAPATPGMWRRGLWSTWGADGLEPTAEVDPSFWAVTMKRRNSKEGSTC